MLDFYLDVKTRLQMEHLDFLFLDFPFGSSSLISRISEDADGFGSSNGFEVDSLGTVPSSG